MTLHPPKPETLAKYGLSLPEWLDLARAQGGACAVCGVVPGVNKKGKPGRLCIDHEHVNGWSKMPPEQRKSFVRGLLCWRCNTTFVGRSITVSRSRAVTRYLELYATRKGHIRDQAA